MIPTEIGLENFTLNIAQEIQIDAPLAVAFDALLEQIGPANERDNGVAMPMKIEPWPGGRWYRDLGGENGHLWGHVQAIKRPTLLEICGPLFASYPLINNVQYRLAESKGGTLLTFRHTALGFLQDDHRAGVKSGWDSILQRVRRRAESR